MKRDCLTLITDRMKSAACLVAVFLCASTAMADPVTVRSAEGGLVLIGDVIGYDGEFLQMSTDYGPLTLRYGSVICEGSACPDADAYIPKVRLSGASRMAEVAVPALVEAFGRSNGWQSELVQIDPSHFDIILRDDSQDVQAEFTFRVSNTDEGFADLIAYEADMAMAVREVRADEAEIARTVGLGDLTAPQQSRIIGLDALVPVVHPALGLDAIALKDVALAYRGEINNWVEIGGPDLPIVRHLGLRTSGSVQFFVDHAVRQESGKLAQDVTFHTSFDAVAGAVAEIPGSIGMLPYGKTRNTQPLTLRDSCGFSSVPVTTTLKTEDYPLTQPLFLYLPDRRQPKIVRDFLAWLRGPEAQLVVRRAGFVDQGAVPISLDAQGQRFANAIAKAGEDIPLAELQRLIRVLMPRTRLSTSFRFEVGSTRLDAQSRSNLMSLGQAIRDGRHDGQSLMLVGFSDGRGAPAPNRDLSSARAEAVKRALVAVLGSLPENVMVETEAFGEALPMGCDDTEWGRQSNRRVELWVVQRNP
ncbi:MAG: phosphate transport system substrate-binding protein [Yoonia sp.]|jgi:phosphate transport system substrate-binding protein